MNSNSHESKKNFPIVQVIKSFLQLDKKGSNYWGICPFHQDSKPSLSVSEEKNIFKCFSCGVSGDAVSFVMKYKKCNYLEAIKNVCNILGLNSSDFLSERENLNSKLFELNNLVADSYHKYLFNESSKKYLDFLINKRNLNLETIKQYKIGFAPKEDILSPILEKFNKLNIQKKFSDEHINTTGLFINKNDGSKYPFFTSRIIFPIWNKNKQIVGFSGRSIDDNIQPKYLNSKSSEIFSKQDSLFNIHNLEKNKKIFLFEGFFDLLNAQQSGIENGLALMGSNLNNDFFLSLKNFSDELVLVLDNDNTGRNLNIKIFENAVKQGFSVSIINFLNTKYKDIDEFLNSDKKSAISVIKNPINFFEWFNKFFFLNNKDINPINLKLLISKCLKFLFFNRGEEIFLFSQISIEYAKKSLKIIFNFYKQSKEFNKPEFLEIIKEEKRKYEEAITKNLIQSNNSENSEEFLENLEEVKTFDLSNNAVLKHRSILFYFINNHSYILKKYDSKNWFFNLPEDFLIFDSIKTFLSIFKNYLYKTKKSNISKEEEQEFLNFLRYEKYISDPVRSIDEFFNQYFSFNNTYLKDFIKFLEKDNFLSPEEKYAKKLKINELIKENKSFSINFFKKF